MSKANTLIKLSVSIPLAVAVLSGVQAAEEGKLYRYKDAAGKTVISVSIPPELVANGYDVLNRNGRLLQTVAPHVVKSDAERAAEKLKRSQQEEDVFLLKSYSTVAEIEAARDRKLESLKRDIALIEDNLKKTDLQRKQEERKAANMQRSGRDVSASLLKTLAELDQKELDAKQALQSRREECEREKARYTAYIERFRHLSK